MRIHARRGRPTADGMSAHRGLAMAGLLVSGAFLVSRVLGWLRYVVMVEMLGAGRELDAFLAAFRLPDLMFQLVAAGALSSAVIPIAAALFAADEELRVWRVISTIANLMLAALLALGLLVFVTAPWLVPLITPGFVDDPPKLERTIELTRIMVLSPILLALGSVATSLLNARNRFSASVLAPIVYNLAIIAGTIFLFEPLGVTGLAVAVVLGSLGHLLVQVPALVRLGYRYAPRIDLGDEHARRALTLMAPRAIGLGVTQITFVVVTAVASGFGDGGLSAFQLAFVLLQIPLGVIGVPLGVVVLPSLSRDAAIGNVAEFAGLVSRALRLLLFVMIPIAGIGMALSAGTVDVVFGGGRTEPATLDLIAATLVTFLLGLAAHAMIAVLARGFYALQDTVTPVVAAVVSVVINTSLSVVFALSLGLGLPGIGLAIAVGAWIEALILLAVLRRRTPELALAPITLVGIRSLAAAVAASVVAFAIDGALALIGGTEPSRIATTVRVTLAGGAGLLVYLALAAALRIPELPSIVGVMADLLRRPRRA
jgi:putative peptidoglycan lipid II flippase